MTSHSVFTGNPLLDHWTILEQSQGAIMVDQVNPFDRSFDHRVPLDQIMIDHDRAHH